MRLAAQYSSAKLRLNSMIAARGLGGDYREGPAGSSACNPSFAAPPTKRFVRSHTRLPAVCSQAFHTFSLPKTL